MPDFEYADLLPTGPDETPYRLLTTEGVSTVEAGGRTFLQVEPEALRLLTDDGDARHRALPAARRTSRSCGTILDDPEASPNDRFVALDLLKNANIAAGGVLPMCQDTGTAIVMGKSGQHVLTDGDDEAAHRARRLRRLHPAQPALLADGAADDVGREEHRLQPARADRALRRRRRHDAYKFLFMAKGGGSANKSFLYQETKAILNPEAMLAFLEEKIRSLGTAACPPYHLAIVIGGTSRGVRAEDREVRLGADTSTTLPTAGRRCRRTASATWSWRSRCSS